VPTSVWSQQEYDKVMTNFPLVITNGKPLLSKVVADPSVPSGKISILKEAIFSTGSYENHGKLVFGGWEGALLKASANHHLFFLPAHLKVADSPNDLAQITITLTDNKSDLGYLV
jgi:hypothetical protein